MGDKEIINYDILIYMKFKSDSLKEDLFVVLLFLIVALFIYASLFMSAIYIIIALGYAFIAIVSLINNLAYRKVLSRRTIIASYEAPEEIHAMEAAILIRNKIDRTALSAVLLDLSMRKYFKIDKYLPTNKRELAEFSIIRPGMYPTKTDNLYNGERTILSKLFSGFELDNITMQKAISLFHIFQRSSIEKSARYNLETLGLTKPLSKMMNYSLAIQLLLAPLCIVSLLFVFLEAIASHTEIPSWAGLVYPLILAFMAILCPLLVYRNSHRLTEKGLGVYDKIQGLKLYISLAEADRIKFFQSAKNIKPEKVDAYLVYATLFGIERSWVVELWK